MFPGVIYFIIIIFDFVGRVDIDLNIKGECDTVVLNANKFTDIKVLSLKTSKQILRTNPVKRYLFAHLLLQKMPSSLLVYVRKRETVEKPISKKGRPCPGRFKTGNPPEPELQAEPELRKDESIEQGESIEKKDSRDEPISSSHSSTKNENIIVENKGKNKLSLPYLHKQHGERKIFFIFINYTESYLYITHAFPMQISTH